MPTNLTSSIELIFRGTNLIGTAATSALRDVDRFNRGVQTAVAPVALLTTGVLALEAAGARFAVSFAKDAFDASIDFGRAQTELAKVLGDNEGNVEDFTGEVFKLSNTFAVSATETLGAVAQWKQAGFTAKEAAELTEQGLRLVIAGDIEAARATELLIRSIKGFELGVKDTAPFLDVLNAITQKYGVNLDQIGEATARAAPIAKNLGFTYAELAGLLTPVVEQTQNAEMSARGFRTAMLRLSDPTKEIASEFARLGVETKNSDGSLRSVKDILADLGPAFNGLTNEQKAQTSAIIAGKDQAAIFTTILENLDKSANATAVGLAGVGTSIENEVNARFKSAAILVDRAGVALDNFKITVGRQFRTELAGVADGFGEIFRELNRLGEGGSFDKFFAEVNPRLGEIERIAREVAQALPNALENADYSGFGEGIDALFGDLSNIQIDDGSLAEFITSVGNGFADLAKFTSGVIDVFRSVAAVVGPVISAYGDLDETTQNYLTGLGAGALVISVFGGAVAGIITIATAATGAYVKLSAAALAFNASVSVTPAVASAAAGSLAVLGSRIATLGAAAGAAGVGLLAFELAKLADANDRIVPDWLAGYEDATFGTVIADVADLVKGTNNQIEASVTLNDVFKETKRVASDSVFGGFETELLKVQGETSNTIASLTEMNAALAANDASAPRILTLDEDEVAERLGRVGSAVTKLGEDTKAGTEVANQGLDEFSVKALEIASNERIALIQSKVELDIAGLEADARVVEATFRSLDTTINSTGDLLGNLFGLLPQLDRFDQLAIFQQIEKEDRRRERALELQEHLVEAQIDKMEAQTRQIRKGKALIQVDASPLKPHLQNILHEILAQIQLEGNGDITEFLLNVNPGLNLPLASAAG